MTQLNQRTIGIITVPIAPTKTFAKVCGDSYVSASYVTWLRNAGINILPIPYTTTRHQYYFERVNGLFFPGGGVYASNDLAYYKCCQKFFQLAVKANNQGDYFPIWGTCLGMQQMLIIVDGHDNMQLLERFDSFKSLKLPLLFTLEGLNTRLVKYLLHQTPDLVETLSTTDITVNNHMMGLSPATFNRNPKLKAFFTIVSDNYDRQGLPFISIIEAKHYPFYGVQWHPEVDPQMLTIGHFLRNELSQNQHIKKLNTIDHLQEKQIKCYQYSGIYKLCYFYWHQKTNPDKINLCRLEKRTLPPISNNR